jgi:glutamyl-Q tRNA(Asp) synthetase
VHRVLQTLLDLRAPVYRHHRLILDRAGKKLSKSEGAESLRTLRSNGRAPADIRRLIGF